MDFQLDASKGEQREKEVQQHADLGVKPGTAEDGDGAKLFRSHSYDPGPADKSEMHNSASARERAVNVEGGHGDSRSATEDSKPFLAARKPDLSPDPLPSHVAGKAIHTGERMRA